MVRIILIVSAILISGCVTSPPVQTEYLIELPPPKENHARVFISGDYVDIKEGVTLSDKVAALGGLFINSNWSAMGNFSFNYIQKQSDNLIGLFITAGKHHRTSYYIDLPSGEVELLMVARNIQNFYAMQSKTAYIKQNLETGKFYQIIGGHTGSSGFTWRWG